MFRTRPLSKVASLVPAVLVAVVVFLAAHAPAAGASPTASLLPALRGSPPNVSIWDQRPFLAAPDGSIFTLTDSAHYTYRSKTYSEADKRLTLQVAKILPSGKVDRVFAKSQIGRGVKFGRGAEFWNFQAPVLLNPTTAIVTGFAKLSSENERSVRIAFDINSGALFSGFGTGG